SRVDRERGAAVRRTAAARARHAAARSAEARDSNHEPARAARARGCARRRSLRWPAQTRERRRRAARASAGALSGRADFRPRSGHRVQAHGAAARPRRPRLHDRLHDARDGNRVSHGSAHRPHRRDARLLRSAAVVARASNDAALLLFFAYVATLWFGCSSAAQEIVREIAIYRRERIVGVSRAAYAAGKFLFLGALTASQSLLFYLCLQAVKGG